MFLRCLSSCDLNLSTEQEDTMLTYLSNLLNILMECHLKLLKDSVPSWPMFTCEATQDWPLRSEYVHVMGVGGEVRDQLLNYFQQINNFISVSPSLYRVEVQEF